MSEENMQQAAGADAGEATSSGPLLSEIINLTPATKADRARDLIDNLVKEAMTGTVVYEKSLSQTINKAIKQLDERLSEQLRVIMQHPDFQALEGSWRGFRHLVFETETSTTLHIKVLNVSKRELFKDLDRAVEFDQSELFKKVYTQEFGMPGGEPYGALVADYEFTSHKEDIAFLEKVSGVAGAAHAPFIASANPGMFGLETMADLSKPRDLAKIFESAEYTKWRSFRESDDSRWVTLTMPRTLAREPYGSNNRTVDEFNYEEVPLDKAGRDTALDHDSYTWMSTAYVLGARLTDSFAKNKWCTAIRGAENGGKVEGLPTHVFKSMDGDSEAKCPTEISIDDRREAELSKLGFLPLCHYKKTDYAVFFGGQTTQRPKKYRADDATASAKLSAGLPYLMAASRIAHYLKVIARDKIGSFKEREDVHTFLHNWVHDYVSADPNPSEDDKRKFPLASAEIEVVEDPASPGVYSARARLRPWTFFEELNTSISLVSRLPKKA